MHRSAAIANHPIKVETAARAHVRTGCGISSASRSSVLVDKTAKTESYNKLFMQRQCKSTHQIVPCTFANAFIFVIIPSTSCRTFDTGAKGQGLKAAEDISAGRLVTEYTGIPSKQQEPSGIDTCSKRHILDASSAEHLDSDSASNCPEGTAVTIAPKLPDCAEVHAVDLCWHCTYQMW